MAFTLRVVFEGVFAFVPDKPFFVKNDDGTWKSGDASQVWVLAPDLRRPDLADWDRASGYAKPDFRPSHFTIVSAAPKHIQDKSEGLFDRLIATHDGDDKELLKILKGAHLEFRQGDKPLDGGLKPNVTVPRSGYQTKPTIPGVKPEEVSSLWWLPRLAEIAPDYAYARELLKPTASTNPAPEELAAVLSLNSGTLSIVRHNGGGDTLWNFTKVVRTGSKVIADEDAAHQTWKRAIGNQLAWDTFIEADHVELRIRFPDADLPPIKLWPPFRGAREVVLFVRNREPELTLIREEESGIEFDPDFQVFYQLGAPTAGSPTRRYPFDPDAASGVEDKPCAGGGYQGFTE